MASDESLRAFARRPWGEIAEAKARYWTLELSERGPAKALQVAAALYAEARAVRPEWPSSGEREADLEHHRRLAEALEHAASLGRR